MNAARLALLLALGSAAAADKIACGACLAMQETIWRSIHHNITALEVASAAGHTQTATVEIGQIIWHLCDSDTWKEQRYAEWLNAACGPAARDHVETMTNYWKEKTTDEYKDRATALRMKRAVCPNSEVAKCRLEDLPNDYSPLRVDECGVCKAIVSDIFGTVRFSRERPTSSKPNKRESRDDNYFRLLGHMSRVCDDLPFRHAFRAEEKDAVSEMCEDIWDEHESTFQSLALKRKPDFAAAVCSSGLDICEDDMTDGELYAHDPGASRSKDEL